MEVDDSTLDESARKDAFDRAIKSYRIRIDKFGVAEPVIQKQGEKRIIVANLPNYAGMPFTASYAPIRKQAIQKISVDLSIQVINRLADSGVAVVDLLCDARFYDPGFYARDGFHPNDRGYRLRACSCLSPSTASGHGDRLGAGDLIFQHR